MGCLQFHQTVGTGIQGPEGIVYLQVIPAVEPVVQGIGAAHRLVRVHGNGIRQPFLIHGGVGQRPSQPAPAVDICCVLHIVAACIDESGRSAFDHLKGCRLGAKTHFPGRQSALKGKHDPGPDNGLCIQHLSL